MPDEEEIDSAADRDRPVPDEEDVDSAANADVPQAATPGGRHSAADRDGPVPDEEDVESLADADAPEPETSGGRIFSIYGLASAVLGIVSVAAIVFGVITWLAHHREVDDRAYQSRVLRTAANWTSVLINLNSGNVDAGMTRLRGKTAGQFNAEFDTVMQPYRTVMQKIPPRSTGRVESVSIESVHRDLGAPAGAKSTPPPLSPPPSAATRTDTVMVVATSVFNGQEGKPETVRWDVQLGVSEVGGTLLISGLAPFR